MLRSRFSRVIVLLACLVAVVYLLISLFLPSSRRLIVGVNKRNGTVRVAQSHITFLPPWEFYRLSFDKSKGYAQRDGFIRITSKEGVPVTIKYRLHFDMAGAQIHDVRRLVNDGFNSWIGARVAEAVSAVTTQVPIEELLSPTSQFRQRHDVLTKAVSDHLRQSGLRVTAFEIASLDADRESLLRAKRAQLRREARGSVGRVAIFAIDGADWELISELADDKRIPNLHALVVGGTSGSTQTIQPTVSPMLWTTVATGLPPDRHGVIDFIDHSRNQPVDSYSRRTPALWDIAEAFGRHSAAVNWWTDWPATSSESAFFDSPVVTMPGEAYPQEVAPLVQANEVPASTLGYQQVSRFLNVNAGEYETAVNSGNDSDPINLFRNILAKTWTDHRVAMKLYEQQKPLLFMMSYEGTDAVNHLFSPYHPPYREGISQESYRKYWPAVGNYYAEVDRMIGEWMNVLPPDTTVIIVSAHGFRWGKNRPRSMPNGAAISDHRNPGIFIAYGNHVAPSRAMHALSIYDIAPTTLAILGLPQSAEMPGHVTEWAFKDIKPVQSVRVVSYSEFMTDLPLGRSTNDPKAYQTELQAIGHLADPNRVLTPQLEDQDEPETAAKPIPPQQWASYAYYNNLGIELKKQNKTKEAVEAFQKAIELNPTRPTPYLNMAMTMMGKVQYVPAEEAFMQAVAHGLPNADRWFCDFAAFYREQKAPTRAITLLYKGKQVFPQSYPIAANLGATLINEQRYTEGLPELERALGLQPSSTMVLNDLGIYYAKQKDYARALDFWNRSLAIDTRQPQIRVAADAARSQL